MSDIELRLIDPIRNRFRVYGITECPTLFGELGLFIAWGRIGHRLRTRFETFEDAVALDARRSELLARRRRRGYVDVQVARAGLGAVASLPTTATAKTMPRGSFAPARQTRFPFGARDSG